MHSRILIVDGFLDHAISYSAVLEGGGFDVVRAQDGNGILRLLGDARPDVILMDAALPDGRGTDVAQGVCRRQRGMCIPVVLVAAGDSVPAAGLERVPGVRAVIFKPCRPRTLLDTVEGVLRWRRCFGHPPAGGCFFA